MPGTLIMTFLRPIGCPQSPRFLDRALRLVRKERRHFQAHEAVSSVRFVVYGLKDCGRVLDVGDSERFVRCLCVVRARFRNRGQRVLVIRAPENRLLENRGIRRDSRHPAVVDELLELTARDEVPSNVIEPDGLAELSQAVQRVRGPRGFSACGMHLRLFFSLPASPVRLVCCPTDSSGATPRAEGERLHQAEYHDGESHREVIDNSRH